MGNNAYGQLGDGTTIDRNSSVCVVEANVTAVAAGTYSSFFLKKDGSLWGMGTNSKFQMGTGSNKSYLIPTKLVDGNITDIVAGANHSFYLDSNGSLWTMGRNESGQLGDGTTTPRKLLFRFHLPILSQLPQVIPIVFS